MASSWTRMRLYHVGNIRVSRLVTPVLILIVFFITYRLMVSPSYGIVSYKQANYPHKMPQSEIDEYLRALEDTRPQQCRTKYNSDLGSQKQSVSILVYFNGEDLYNLKLTLSSIVEHTPAELYREIVVLDDGTENYQIRQHAAEFLLREKFKGKIRPFRAEKTHGRGSTRFKASRVAQGEILVFIDSSVVVNTGWLEPLIAALGESENRIVVPHSENILSEKRFFHMDDSLVSTFSWPLSTVYKETSEENSKYLRCPVMRGDILAVSKDYLEKIGNYDDDMGVGGGDELELSLRTWLCGGEILVVLCSRVAVHNALKPVDVTTDRAVRRVAELWLGEHKDFAYRQTETDRRLPAAESQSLKIRKSFLAKQLECRPFGWYLDTIAWDVITPSDEMVQFGKLKASSAYCARSSVQDSSELDLVLCRPFMYDVSMIFEYDNKGRIRKGDRCLLAPGKSSRIILTECQEDIRQQIWRPKSAALTCDAFPGWCLSHVTVSGPRNVHQHHAELSECKDDKDLRQIWSFIRY